jgi:chromosome segregation ATPase
MQAESARSQIAEQLMNCKSEMNDLADDNDRLVTEIADLREQLANANSSIASAEGRIAQLNGELLRARDDVSAERASTEAARLATVKLQMRVDALAPLSDELREARHLCERERTARTQAEQNVAVLETRVSALDDQVRHLGVEVEDSRSVIRTLNAKAETMSEALISEREARVVAERDLAVMSAVRSGRHSFIKLGGTRRRKNALQQQGNGEEGNSAH